MYINKNKITFHESDMPFVEKFGVVTAAKMVREYKSVYPMPFIYDNNQLIKFLPIGRKDFYKLIRNCDKSYKSILLKKESGKIRQIYMPNDKLKNIQNRILYKILYKLAVSKYATAYVKGRSLLDNALPHVGKRYMLKLDITDFFSSITFEQVYSAAFNTKYFTKQVGVLLTTLCCRRDVLPQGAPTSPALSNMVMQNFDNNIGKWCENHGISYTRYCDDMTFSSDEPLYHVYQKAKAMLNEMGFELNEKKTHFITNVGRQSVTGLTVNEKVSVSSDYKRKLRQEVYYTLKFGLTENILRSNKKEFLVGSLPDAEKYYHHLLGRIRFVLQIEPDNEWFQKAVEQMETSPLLQGEVMLRKR